MKARPMLTAYIVYERIRHGDEKHQAWLRAEVDKLFAEYATSERTPYTVEVCRRYGIPEGRVCEPMVIEVNGIAQVICSDQTCPIGRHKP